MREWHIDIEDRHTLKLVIYLSDVDGADDGPFEYLDREATERARSAIRYLSGFVADERLAQATAREEWRQVTGPRFTAAVADTCGLFHRARPPVSHDRYSMTYSYCSDRPFQVLREYLPNRQQAFRLREQLTPRQLAAAQFA